MGSYQKKKILYDIDKIRESVKPFDVVRAAGIPYVRKGNNIFIRCPDHENRVNSIDRHISNCILNDDFNRAYYCFSCHAKGTLFDLISKSFQLDCKTDFHEICEIAADSYGDASYFESNSDSYVVKQKSKQIKEELISKTQQDSIEIHQERFPYIVAECFSSKHDMDGFSFTQDINYADTDTYGLPKVSYLTVKGYNYSIMQLYKDDPEAYKWFVRTKAKDSMDKYYRLYKKDWYSLGLKVGLDSEQSKYCEQYIRNKLKNKYIEAKSVWKQFVSASEYEDLDDFWLYGYDFEINAKLGSVF